jgi:hypothetical protein
LGSSDPAIQQTADTQKRKNATARERMNLSRGVDFLAVAEADRWRICRVALQTQQLLALIKFRWEMKKLTLAIGI